MKVLLLLFLIVNSLNLFAETKSTTSSSKEQQVQQIMKDLNDLDEKEIEDIRKAVDERAQKHFDLRRSKTLGRILLNIRRVGKVRIRNCNDLEVVGDSAEVKTFREELMDFCQQSLRGFWAELDADGILRFSFDMSDSNNSKTTNIGGGGEFTVAYKGHEFLVRGNINDNEVGKSNSQSFKRKFDSRVDYSVDIAIRNLEAFLLWHLDQEDAISTNTDGVTSSGFQRQILATGLRLEFIKKDVLDFKLGFGGGYSFRDAYGTLSLPYAASWSPSIIGTMDFTLKPSSLLSFVANGRVQRDFHYLNPAWVASQSFGLEFKYNGVTMGTRFTVDWDDYRTNAGVPNFGYSGMFTVGVHLADLIGDKEKRDKRKRDKEREIDVWQSANDFADEEDEKRKAKEQRSFIRSLFGY